MGKLYWAAVVAVIISGLAVVFFFGLQGKTVPKIKWSHFANAQEVADSVQLRLSQELQSFDLIFVGPHPDSALHVQSSLKIVEWLKSTKPSLVIVDPFLNEKYNIPHDILLNIMTEPDRFVEGLSQVSQTYRVIVLAPNVYVTHILSQSPVNKMEFLKNKKYIVLSMVNFPENREAEKTFEMPCNTNDESISGFSELGCFIRLQSRPTYNKKRVENKTPGFLNQVRTSEFMFFLGHSP